MKNYLQNKRENAYKYLNELISLDTKINFTKIASDLELDLDEQMTIEEFSEAPSEEALAMEASQVDE